MQDKKLTRCAAIILAAAAAILTMHGVMADSDSHEMSSSCAMICFMQAGAVSDQPLQVPVLPILALVIILFSAAVSLLSVPETSIGSLPFLERHRYLMKTTVILG